MNSSDLEASPSVAQRRRAAGAHRRSVWVNAEGIRGAELTTRLLTDVHQGFILFLVFFLP